MKQAPRLCCRHATATSMSTSHMLTLGLPQPALQTLGALHGVGKQRSPAVRKTVAAAQTFMSRFTRKSARRRNPTNLPAGVPLHVFHGVASGTAAVTMHSCIQRLQGQQSTHLQRLMQTISRVRTSRLQKDRTSKPR